MQMVSNRSHLRIEMSARLQEPLPPFLELEKTPSLAQAIVIKQANHLRNRREISSVFWVIGLQRRQLLLGMSEGHPLNLESDIFGLQRRQLLTGMSEGHS
jgi:hypothetical protein